MREQDEKSTVRHFRTGNRFILQDGEWWFSTREGEEGPFATREAAELGLKQFVETYEMMIKFQTEQPEQHGEKTPSEDRADPSIWDRQIDAL